jgi:hypothetical protein
MLLASADPNDQNYLQASWEIARAHPLYVLRFSVRNMMKYLFDPGYSHTRFNNHGYHYIGLHFIPSAGELANPVTAPERTVREMQLRPLSEEPPAVQSVYRKVMDFWRLHFDKFVTVTSFLVIASWSGVLLRFSCFIAKDERVSVAGQLSPHRFSCCTMQQHSRYCRGRLSLFPFQRTAPYPHLRLRSRPANGISHVRSFTT